MSELISHHRPWSLSARKGFTLVELLVSTAILLIVIFVLVMVMGSMTSIWHRSSGAISNFQAARGAFTTINSELSRATLKTYLDYVNDPSSNNPPFGQFRTSLASVQQQNFVPFGFARASELHFVCGPTAQIVPTGAGQANNPGDAIFFQAPLGVVGAANASSDKYLHRTLNDLGFYIQYSDLSSSAFPSWLGTFLGGSPHYGYRLIQCIQPTENLSIYQQTATGIYSLGWIPPISASSFPAASTTYTEGVLAEDVVLLIFRPRLESQDEQVVAPKLGEGYDSSLQNSIISPNYVYDSRAWQSGYSFAPTTVKSTSYAVYMRNQLPPIVDVAMVCVDPNSVAHLQIANQSTPPAILQPASGLFANSANLDADLTTFGTQLTSNHILYRVFRSSVQIQAAAWANE